MDNLEPITRNEMFLNGDDLEPITREEMILAGADLEPITRHEWFLKRYRGGGGGGGYDLVNIPDLPADIASFNDGTDLPMASLKVAVTPYQDLSHGDPSPENICPIIGWDEAVVTRCGKNLYSHNGISIYDYDFSQQIAFSQMRNPIFMKGGQKYVLSLSENITLFRMRAFDKFQNLVTNASIVNAYNQGSGTGLVFYANGNFFGYDGAGTNSITTFQPTEDMWFDMTVQTTSPSQVMFEIGDTPSTYEPYNGATYTIDLDGTRYGGVVDATNGTMLIDRKFEVYDGSSDETWYTYSNSGFRIPKNDIDASNIGICNIAPTSTSASSYGVSFSSSNNYIYFFQSVSAWGISTVEELRAWLANNNIQVCYKLATPITVQLAPTPVKSIEGVNKIFANCGQITEGKYFKRA